MSVHSSIYECLMFDYIFESIYERCFSSLRMLRLFLVAFIKITTHLIMHSLTVNYALCSAPRNEGLHVVKVNKMLNAIKRWHANTMFNGGAQKHRSFEMFFLIRTSI